MLRPVHDRNRRVPVDAARGTIYVCGVDQPRVDNRTDFKVHPQLLLDKDGEKLAVVVKASFELPQGGDELEVAPEERTRPVRAADIPWGDPEVSSIAYPADLCLRKPGTDLVVVAVAYAPEGRPLASFDVRVEVGKLKKSLKVFGPRVWTGNGGLTPPSPVAEVELRYENAFGGFDDSDPKKVVEEPRNPIGRGKVRDSASRSGAAAPQIEDPSRLIAPLSGDPPPAGVGAIGRSWLPRRNFAGTYDAAWQESRAPLPPDDFDDRFNVCATPELYSATPLVGGEPVKLLNVTPGGGARSFALPRVPLEIEILVTGREPVVVAPHLDTVLVDLLATGPEKPPAVEMVWRTCVRAPRKLRDARVVVRERSGA
jgi:hypothetical protein